MFAGLGLLWLLWLLWSLLPVIALIIALRALRASGRGPGAEDATARLDALDAQLQDLASHVRALSERVGRLEGAPAAEAAPAAVDAAASPPAVKGALPPPAPPAPPPPAEAPPAPARLDLEQRIGARWATWVGIVAILFATSFFIRWAFERDLIGPGLRVTLGLLAGVLLLGAGLLVSRRPDLPYLGEGLSGGGLGVLYLSLYAAHAVYGFVGAGPAFGAMSLVTAVGAFAAAVSGRQAIAVLSVLGGLLTPVLLASDSPDERVLLGYLFVLDLLVLAVARFRTWPRLNWLAWLGTALLLAPGLLREPEPPHLLARLALLSALFLLFLAVPVAREWSLGQRGRDIDLVLVVANAAGYFGAVYWTLEATHPAAEGPWALALAVLYAAVAAESRRRVAEDEAAAIVHLGVADTFLTLGIALAIHGPWVTLAWAAQGLVLLSTAPRVATPVAAWGGLAALGLAVVRVVVVDPSLHPELTPRLTAADLVHAAVVGALVWGGALALRVRPDQLRLLAPDGLAALLRMAAAVVAAVLIWRETTGLWPCALLAAEALALGGLARAMGAPRAPTFAIALPLVTLALLARMLGEDARLARDAAVSLVSGALLLRVGACAALGLAGHWLARCRAEDGAAPVGRALSGLAALALLVVLSLDWIDHQAAAPGGRAATRWQTQVGLSVLWTLYAAAALAWGFLRAAPLVRYAALGLLGVVIVKAFLVDLAAVETVYRIVSFLILGLVLLGVSALYQKARRPSP